MIILLHIAFFIMIWYNNLSNVLIYSKKSFISNIIVTIIYNL